MRNDVGLGRFAPSKDDVAVIGLVVLLYGEHLIFGADRVDVAMFFALIHLILLLAVLATGAGKRALQGAPLAWIAAPFALVLASAMFTTLPVGGKLAHPLWSYVSVAAGSISLDPAATRAEMVKLTGLAAVFCLAIVIGAKRERSETFVKAISYAGGAYALWALLNWSSNPNTVFGVARAFGNGRLAGSFLSANSAATLFACQSLLQLCLVFRAVRRAPKPFFSRRAWSEMKRLPPALILLFLNASCLLMTASRGGAIAAAAAAALAIAGFAVTRTSERSASGGVIAVGALIAFAAAALLLASGGSLLGRLADNPVTDDRLLFFSAYWRSILASPWWGYGLGSFYAENFQSMTAVGAPAMGALGAAHNVYIQWLLEAGVAGFAPMMICVAVILATILGGFRRRSRQQAFMIFALASAALFAIHGMTDFALQEPSLAAYFSAVLGLGYGVSTRA
jgi:O-antigen ligase